MPIFRHIQSQKSCLLKKDEQTNSRSYWDVVNTINPNWKEYFTKRNILTWAKGLIQTHIPHLVSDAQFQLELTNT